ncbi:hypothetical protein HELRODRAFT_194911 [Helobdella robusta]|uniref:Potassium channel domain-containing protein n=1 Tax=Helobdella robusta TaxID=6412 RepID=T1FWK0_HELRO|nr:hypothetical protein HELRODRAFT_194911 [Helobdella robusta]ESO11135.1 hypothetical protein HELRODRAFT_194911 [Helobdella robusta]
MKLLTFLMMLTLLLIYSLIGGVIFKNIETPNEDFVKKSANSTFARLLENNDCLTPNDIADFQDITTDMLENGLLLKSDSNSTARPSAFFRETFDVRSAILVASSIVTGIGIKHAYPVTTGGRIFCIVFSFCISYYSYIVLYSVGFLVDRLLEVFFKKLNKRLTKRSVNVFIHFRQTVLLTFGIIFLVLIPAGIICSVENWPYDQTLYFCFLYAISLGFADYIPGEDPNFQRSEGFIKWYRLAIAFWSLITFLYLSLIIYQFNGLFGRFIWENMEKIVDDRIERVKYIRDNNVYREVLKKHREKYLKKFQKNSQTEAAMRRVGWMDDQKKIQTGAIQSDVGNVVSDTNPTYPIPDKIQPPDYQQPVSNVILYDPNFGHGRISSGEVSVIKF